MYVSASTFAEPLPTSSAISAPRPALRVEQRDTPVLEIVGRPERRPGRSTRSGDRRPQAGRLHPRETGAGEVAIVAGRERSLDRLRERGG